MAGLVLLLLPLGAACGGDFCDLEVGDLEGEYEFRSGDADDVDVLVLVRIDAAGNVTTENPENPDDFKVRKNCESVMTELCALEIRCDDGFQFTLTGEQ